MAGFFSKKETTSNTRLDGKTYSCASCGLYTSCKNPKLKPTGEGKKGILNIGGFASKVDDNRNKNFQGKEYNLLKAAYAKSGINLEKDCINTYAVKCGNNTKPDNYQIDCCRRHIMNVIKEYKPKVIVLFGDVALYSIIGGRWKKQLGKIDKWQGYQIPDQDLKAWVVPTFSVQSINNIIPDKNEVMGVIWERDLQQVSKLINKEFRWYFKPNILTLTEDKLGILDTITDGTIAIDYEATGLKLQDKKHKIKCMSVAYRHNNAYVFEIPKDKNKQKPIIDLLQRKSVKKIAANMKYEETAGVLKFGTNTTPWDFDTMQASHVIDNRAGVTGLKFQSYVLLGIIDYSSEILPYLIGADSKNSNSFNKLDDYMDTAEGLQKVLKYCGDDAINTYRAAEIQKEIINVKQPSKSKYSSDIVKAYDLMHNGILALGEAERQGLRIDTEYCEKAKQKLTRQIKRIEKDIFDSAFYKKWQRTSKSTINLNSGQQLSTYLYKTLKIKPLKETETGQGGTDEEALSGLGIPELDLLIKRSKLLKLRDTYLGAFAREQINGVLHPFFNLHLVDTYRSSSDSPNFQNIPKRDKEAMRTVRRAIYPRKGHQLLEMDYGGIEVAIAACYHKDPQMIDDIINGDMHGDMAAEIFKIKNFDKHIKQHSFLRSATKNSFVFPQFYGDYFVKCAINFCANWLQLPEKKWNKKMGVEVFEGVTIAEHLISQGIKSFKEFTEHLRKIEYDFWHNRYPIYQKWKEKHWAEYSKLGYFRSKTGFTYSGVLSKNKVINYPVQGAAFHCLLWTFTRLTEVLKKRGLKTRLVGQVHDAFVLDVHPDELLIVHKLLTRIGTKDILKAFPWINVPLVIDAELCPIDASWAEKDEWEL